MARIAAAELERIKAEVSLERLAEAKGIELRRHGADFLGLCPFHDDREPSLVISPAKNLWHCLGACQAGGSVIDWVMRAESVSFRHAAELLRTDPSLVAGSGVVRSAQRRSRVLPSPVTSNADDTAALRDVVAYYHATLREAPEAMSYLESRGLADKEVIDHFQLGYANRTLGLRLPPNRTKAGDELRGRLQRLGVIRDTGHEHFNGSLVVPVFDESGQVVEMYGRKIRNDLKPGTPLHLYLPGPHRGVWNADSLTERVILCEALLDALTFYVHGLHNVTAAYGVEGFTDDHLAVFAQRGVERVYIAFDRDAAGDKVAVQLATRLVAAGVDVFRVQFPRDMDANSYACAELDTASERLSALVRKAAWLGQGHRPAKASTAASSTPTAAPDAAAHADADARDNTGQGKERERVAAPRTDLQSVVPVRPVEAPHTSNANAPELSATTSLAADLPSPADAVEVSDDDLSMTFGDRRWRVRGLAKASGDGALRVNLLLRSAEAGERFHVDTLDLYVSKQRAVFVREAAEETAILEETVRRDLGRVLLQTEELLAERRKAEAAAQKQEASATLTEAEKAAALEVLHDPALLDHVVSAYERIGVVGEPTNKLVAYLVATSRLLEQPLAVVVQSSSAAGKSALMEATLALLPDNARVKYSAMTGQSLYYMAERELAHKVLAVVEEQGAERAAYALKLLQSEGELSIASTGKDPQTGRLVTQDYTVRGPVSLFLTTTAIDVDEELLNRCLVLAVDEERDQTRAIHRRQRERLTLDGLVRDAEREQTIALHRAMQALLRPLRVVNPYAPQLTFADSRTRTRRDHQKYLTLISTIALLHQYQREPKRVSVGGKDIEYIEVIPNDVAVANRLAREVLGRSLDELPPQTRRLLLLLDELVIRRMRDAGVSREEVRLTRREIRDQTGWGNSQLAIHLGRLTDLEYLTAYPTGRSRAYVYELVWTGEGAGDAPTLDGLIDPTTLLNGGAYDDTLPGSAPTVPGQMATLPAPFRGASGAVPAPIRGDQNRRNANGHNGFLSLAASQSKNAVPGSDNEEAAVRVAVVR